MESTEESTKTNKLDAQVVQKILLLPVLLALAFLVSGVLLLHSSVESFAMSNLGNRGAFLLQEFRNTLEPALEHQRLSAALIQDGLIPYTDRTMMVRYFAPFLAQNAMVRSLNVAVGDRSFMMLRDSETRFRIREEYRGRARYASCNASGACKSDGSVAYSYRDSEWYSAVPEEDAVIRWTDVYRFRTTGDPGITGVTARHMATGQRLVVAYDLRLIDLTHFFELIRPDENLIPVLYFPEVRAGRFDNATMRGLLYQTGRDQKGLFVSTVDDASDPAVAALVVDPEAALEHARGCRWWKDPVQVPGLAAQIFLCLPESELIRPMETRVLALLLIFAALVLMTIGMSFFIARQITSPYKEQLEHFDHSLDSTTKMLARREKELRHAMMKIQEELELARKTQLSIIPVVSNQYGPLRLTSRYVPANSLGGDFLDLYDLHECLGFLMADVSGHGISSALITMMIKTSSTLSKDMLVLPDAFLRHLNRTIYERTGMHFITALACSVNYSDLTLKVANAGHCYPLLFRRATQEFFDIAANGICLGILEDPTYATVETQLQSGDCLLFYTDGIVETLNDEEQMYGAERLRHTLLENIHLSGDELLDSIFVSLNRFARRSIREDDIAMILLEVE